METGGRTRRADLGGGFDELLPLDQQLLITDRIVVDVGLSGYFFRSAVGGRPGKFPFGVGIHSYQETTRNSIER